MTTVEIFLLLTNLGTGVRWWFDRKDARSILVTGKTKADDAVATLTKALESKDMELTEEKKERQEDRRRMEEDRARDQARIAHLETLIYRREGSP